MFTKESLIVTTIFFNWENVYILLLIHKIEHISLNLEQQE